MLRQRNYLGRGPFPRSLELALAAAWIALSSPTEAAQQLIPAPYPEGFGSTAVIGRPLAETHYHQHLIPTPVPQTLGPNALGHPKFWRHSRHKHLVPTPYWRQYHHFQ